MGGCARPAKCWGYIIWGPRGAAGEPLGDDDPAQQIGQYRRTGSGHSGYYGDQSENGRIYIEIFTQTATDACYHFVV